MQRITTKKVASSFHQLFISSFLANSSVNSSFIIDMATYWGYLLWNSGNCNLRRAIRQYRQLPSQVCTPEAVLQKVISREDVTAWIIHRPFAYFNYVVSLNYEQLSLISRFASKIGKWKCSRLIFNSDDRCDRSLNSVNNYRSYLFYLFGLYLFQMLFISILTPV